MLVSEKNSVSLICDQWLKPRAPLDGPMVINKVHFHLFWKGLCSFRSDHQSRELIRLLIDYNSGVKAMLLINVVHHV